MSEAGLDLALEGAKAPDAAMISRAVAAGAAAGLARLSIGGEPVLTPAEPVLRVAGVAVVPPPGAFLQASAEAEAIMAGLVVEHLANSVQGGAKRAADLFAGLGTFSFALARTMRVNAYEASAPMVAALLRGARTPGLKQIAAERRDLFAFPLSPKELSGFDAVVVDPPWSGAKAQAEALAASKVARIAFVSCNPASFARDARILVEGGYVLERVVPVDQFVYSAETEVVGMFARR
jgi:23S rRNA (uracil1939-C5)-methyltransferase